jgi:hypothetical protein
MYKLATVLETTFVLQNNCESFSLCMTASQQTLQNYIGIYIFYIYVHINIMLYYIQVMIIKSLHEILLKIYTYIDTKHNTQNILSDIKSMKLYIMLCNFI